MADVLKLGRPLESLVNNVGVLQFFALAGLQALARIGTEMAVDMHAAADFPTALLLHLPDQPVQRHYCAHLHARDNAPSYIATSAALHDFTRSLRWSTRASRLRVVELKPPVIETELIRGYDGPKITLSFVAKVFDRRLGNRVRNGPSQDVLRYIVRGSQLHLACGEQVSHRSIPALSSGTSYFSSDCPMRQRFKSIK